MTVSIPSAGNGTLTPEFWDQCLAVGEVAPEFTLPNGAGERVRLDELLDAGPVLVAFDHGQECAVCAEERRALEASAALLHATGASLLVISTDCNVAAESRNAAGRGWHEVLWDCEGSVAHLFGLLCRLPGGCGEAQSNARAHYILDGDAVVRYAAVDLVHDRPLDLAAIQEVLTGLMSKETPQVT